MKSFLLGIALSAITLSPLLSDEITVIYNDDFYPFEYKNSRDQPEGFVIDLIYALSREAAVEIHWRAGEWQERENAIYNGLADLTSGYFIQSSNPSIVTTKTLFSVPFSLLYRTNLSGSVNEPGEGRKALISSGDSSYPVLEKRNGAELTVSSSLWSDIPSNLEKGFGDYALLSTLHWSFLQDKYIDSIISMENFDLQLPYVLFTSSRNTYLLEKMNNGLSIIKASGEYERIYNKWFPHQENALVTDFDDPQILRYILLSAIVIIFISSIIMKKRKGK